jgi:hypothetical protein
MADRWSRGVLTFSAMDADILADLDPVLRLLLNETGISPRASWAWLGMLRPFPETGTMAQLHLRGYIAVSRPGTTPVPAPVNETVSIPFTQLGEGWRGHSLELFGLFRGLETPTLQFEAPTVTPGGAPTFKLWDPGPRIGLVIELWYSRAYRTPADPLISEQRWVPGEDGMHDSFRVTIPATRSPTLADLRAAQKARAMLHRVRWALGRVGRHPEYDEANELQLLQVLNSAEELGRDRRSVKGWVEGSPWDLEAIEREALRCTGPLRVNLCTFHVRRADEYRRKGV